MQGQMMMKFLLGHARHLRGRSYIIHIYISLFNISNLLAS